MFEFFRRRVRRRASFLHYAEEVAVSDLQEQAELVALLRERPGGLSWPQLASAVLEHGTPAEARANLVQDSLFGDAEHEARIAQAQRDVESWASAGLQFWTIVDERYPARVRDIQEAPPFLIGRGNLVEGDAAVSVVGSRKASDQGLKMATAISDALVSMNLTVVAGLAAGIDTAAHRTALERGGRTVAVIGTGINRHYPAANRELQDQIAEQGLLISQFWPDAPPQQHNFPMRNAVMSGYGIATVVVEAGEHSGARIQARMAVHHGRPVILTDLVVNSTTWGKELLDRPDVYLASSIDEVTTTIHELAERPERLGAVLDLIAV
jgi:DNA processing protein